MKIQQLLENAHLDALGMLDASEQAEFQHALASAPDAVRRHIREEQARVADISHLLPDVAPSPQLRERVLAAVAAQISAQLLAEAAAEQKPDLYEMRRPERVSRRWRAATVAMIGACGVLTIAFVNVLTINSQIKQSMAVLDLPREVTIGLGSEHTVDVLFGDSTRRDRFRAVGDAGGAVSLLHDSSWDSGLLSYKGLVDRAGSEYRLVVLDAQGRIIERVATLDSSDDKQIRTLRIEGRFLMEGTRLAVVSASVGGADAEGVIRFEARLS